MVCNVMDYVEALGEIETDGMYREQLDMMTVSVYSVALQMGWYATLKIDEEGDLVALIG